MKRYREDDGQALDKKRKFSDRTTVQQRVEQRMENELEANWSCSTKYMTWDDIKSIPNLLESLHHSSQYDYKIERFVANNASKLLARKIQGMKKFKYKYADSVLTLCIIKRFFQIHPADFARHFLFDTLWPEVFNEIISPCVVDVLWLWEQDSSFSMIESHSGIVRRCVHDLLRTQETEIEKLVNHMDMFCEFRLPVYVAKKTYFVHKVMGHRLGIQIVDHAGEYFRRFRLGPECTWINACPNIKMSFKACDLRKMHILKNTQLLEDIVQIVAGFEDTQLDYMVHNTNGNRSYWRPVCNN